MLEIKTCLSKIVRHFEILPAIPQEKIVFIPEITLVTKNGIRVSLRKRQDGCNTRNKEE